MTLVVSPVYTALLALFILYMGYRVSMLRRSEGVALGSGSSPSLLRARSAHQHALENVPVSLLLLLMLEINGNHILLLHVLGSLLLISRLLHYVGQSRHSGRSFGRYWGTVINWLLIIVMAAMNLYMVFPTN
ncbi:MAG: MAPEG family protein [Gammaproteobacteria bacterium]|nr:MAPEG family protein [Gammaproteobacteria bacterium]